MATMGRNSSDGDWNTIGTVLAVQVHSMVTNGRLTRRDAARQAVDDADPLRAEGRLTRTVLVRMSPAIPAACRAAGQAEPDPG